MREPLLLSAFGRSGSGKGTFVRFVQAYCAEHDLSVTRLRLAEPLYQLQQEFRHHAGVTLPPEAQDQVLMEIAATQLRRLNPRALVDRLLSEMDTTDADIVLNDDLRDPHTDYPAMLARGFHFVRIECAEHLRRQRLLSRGDVTRSDASTSGIDKIRADFVLDNSGEMEAFRRQVDRLMGEALAAYGN